MKKVSLIKYHLKGVSANRKTQIHRALYGYVDHSNKGNYNYERKGVLNKIKYNKVSNSVLLIDFEDLKQVRPLFKKYGIKVSVINLFKKP